MAGLFENILTNKTNLTEETFVKLRLQKKNLNHKEFAEYLNTQTKYYPDP
jgi:DNA-binding transcriptional regulator YiaG